MIRPEGLARTFRGAGGEVHAVCGIYLTLATGETVAVLGPNGAGHSHQVLDEVVTHARIYSLCRMAARARAGELIDMRGLAELAGRACQTLSGGQRRQLDLAMGLVHPTLDDVFLELTGRSLRDSGDTVTSSSGVDSRRQGAL